MSENIKIEGARLIFKNFQGKATAYNDEGNRNFGVLLDEEIALCLKEDGWNVKYLRPRDDDPERFEQPWLPVKVKFNPYPPVVMLINSRGKKRLDEETIEQLDWAIINNCDLIIRPYNYPSVAGRPSGISAYLKAIYVTISEDELAEKYSDVPDLDERYEDSDDQSV